MAVHTDDWRKKIVTPERVFEKIKPGMSIFIGTGVAEPRTLVKSLMASNAVNLRDLELIQLISLGDAVSIEDRYTHKYRLKTFYSGWVASEAITSGQIDFIPTRFSRIPHLIESGTLDIDIAFIQITPPDVNGYSSLGAAVDVQRPAMEQASLRVGEINTHVPRTQGDTFVNINEFDLLVESNEMPIYFDRWPVDDVYDRVSANVASLIQDCSCVPFAIGPLFEGLARHLTKKRNLGIVTPVFTDALMDLVKSGAVTNRCKGSFRGKCLTSYAIGTPELMQWLDNNPFVEFQGIDVVGDPIRLGRNDDFIVVLPARKIDLTGNVVLHTGKGHVGSGTAEAQEYFMGAALSKGGRTIFALPSRNLQGQSNILLSVEDLPNQLTSRESLDLIVTEYGYASLTGRTVRERALALIDISHPDDRAGLVQQAKEHHLLYRDQEYLAESGLFYPGDMTRIQNFRDGLVVRFRPIKPSDVDEMRRLFYRFSDRSVYYRYFSPVKAMPHSEMQEYVNVDYRKTMSIVGLIGEPGIGDIIAEARYVALDDKPYADVAFIVDEAYQGKGIASYLLNLLIESAKERGFKGFTADVLADNRSMLKVFEKAPYPYQAVLRSGVYELTIPFYDESEDDMRE